ncbi:hypothetical protein GF407_18900 [candidate division KSB1 bacterium]|nr:hypothetical protein [candidate division KSB1 bacterium]
MNIDVSYQIQHIFAQIVKYRKIRVFSILVLVLVPVIIYNRITPPVYESSALLALEKFESPDKSYGYDTASEIMLVNRIEEIKSISFIEEVYQSLTPRMQIQIQNRILESVESDTLFQISKAILDNMSAYSIRNSDLIRLTFRAHDATLVQALAANAAGLLQKKHRDIRDKNLQQMNEYLDSEITHYADLLRSTENELRSFKQVNKFTTTSEQAEQMLTLLTEAEILNNEIRVKRVATREKLANMGKELDAQRKNLVPRVTELSASLMAKLKQKQLELYQQYVELQLQNYPEAHPKMQQIQKDIADTEKRLQEQAVRLLEQDNLLEPVSQMQDIVRTYLQTKLELEALTAQENALGMIIQRYQESLNTLPTKEQAYARLARDKELYENLYSMLIQKKKNTDIAQNEEMSRVRIVDKARTPLEAVSPRKKFNLAVGFLFGLLVAFGSAFYLEWRKNPVPPEALTAATGWPLLGSLKDSSQKTSKDAQNDISTLMKKMVDAENQTKISGQDYYDTAFQLQLRGVGKEIRSVLMTSIDPHIDTALITANLAFYFAQSNIDSIIVENPVNGRHPGLGVKEPGLSDYAEQLKMVTAVGAEEETRIETKTDTAIRSADLATMNAFIRNTALPNLQVIPKGNAGNKGFLTMELFNTLISGLPDKLVWIESAGILSDINSRNAATSVDATILVVDEKSNREKDIFQIQQFWQYIKGPILGILLLKT